MAVINNLQAFHAAMAALAPIVGVDAAGKIFFDTSATPAQIAAANAAAATYTDAVPQMIVVELALSRMTDAEYQALFAFAQTHPNLHRLLQYTKTLDMALAQSTTLLNALVTANVFATAARAQAVFTAPPVPTLPPVAATPQPTTIHSMPAPLL